MDTQLSFLPFATPTQPKAMKPSASSKQFAANGVGQSSTEAPATALDLRARDVKVDPMPTSYKRDEQGIEYKYALITISYTRLFTEITIDSTLTFITINPSGLFWNLDPAMPIAAEQAPGFRLPTFDMTLSNPYMSIKFGNNKYISDFDGCCNQEELIIWHLGFKRRFPPETLVCSAPSIRTLPNVMDLEMCAVSLKLSYNPIGHNAWYHPLKNPGTATTSWDDHKVTMHSGMECSESNRIKPVPVVPFLDMLKAFDLQYVNSGPE